MSIKDKCITYITTKYGNKLSIIFFIFIITIGIFLRFHNINFGLPHNFYADEPEFVEFAIKYTFELKDVIKNNNWYKLIPLSYVYGTVTTYILTFFTIIYVQVTQILNLQIEKIDIYVLNRSINALISILMVPSIYVLAIRMFKNRVVAIISASLILLNYKLIVHSHYVNADLFLSVFILLSIVFLYLYQQTYSKKINYDLDKKNISIKNNSFTLQNIFAKNSFYVVLSALFFGLAIGTKVTSLLTLPLHWFIFLYNKEMVNIKTLIGLYYIKRTNEIKSARKYLDLKDLLVFKDLRSFFAFNFIVFGTFMVTNPFSILYINDFLYRVYSMTTIEAGMVFDSVNYNVFKYIFALSDMVTLNILILFFYGIFIKVKNKKFTEFDIFLILNIVFYLVFYSLQSRRVDRWLLPIISIVFLYSSYGIYNVILDIINKKSSKIKKYGLAIFLIFTVFYYNFYNYVIFNQFQRYTPKSLAYLYMQENIDFTDPKNNVLSYTQEGLDPLNKLPNSSINQVNVYESKGAQLFYPTDPLNYEFVVMASRPMQNYKRKEVKQKYSNYAKRWQEYENKVLDENNFKLIKSFETTKLNLIPLSSVYIYQRVK